MPVLLCTDEDEEHDMDDEPIIPPGIFDPSNDGVDSRSNSASNRSAANSMHPLLRSPFGSIGSIGSNEHSGGGTAASGYSRSTSHHRSPYTSIGSVSSTTSRSPFNSIGRPQQRVDASASPFNSIGRNAVGSRGTRTSKRNGHTDGERNRADEAARATNANSARISYPSNGVGFHETRDKFSTSGPTSDSIMNAMRSMSGLSAESGVSSSSRKSQSSRQSSATGRGDGTRLKGAKVFSQLLGDNFDQTMADPLDDVSSKHNEAPNSADDSMCWSSLLYGERADDSMEHHMGDDSIHILQAADGADAGPTANLDAQTPTPLRRISSLDRLDFAYGATPSMKSDSLGPPPMFSADAPTPDATRRLSSPRQDQFLSKERGSNRTPVLERRGSPFRAKNRRQGETRGTTGWPSMPPEVAVLAHSASSPKSNPNVPVLSTPTSNAVRESRRRESDDEASDVDDDFDDDDGDDADDDDDDDDDIESSDCDDGSGAGFTNSFQVDNADDTGASDSGSEESESNPEVKKKQCFVRLASTVLFLCSVQCVLGVRKSRNEKKERP